MDQISAVVRSEFHTGAEYLVTDYEAKCGCRWSVDYRGNVRRAHVCRDCMEAAGLIHKGQLTLF